MQTSELVQKWIDETRASKEVAPEEPISRAYDNKLVAWIDILGMRERMKTEENAEEIFSCMETIQNFVEVSCESLVAKNLLNFLQISDGFIIVAELDTINEFCEILCKIQWNVLIHQNMAIRGAVTAGKVSMSDDSRLIIGPGFIEAFVMESENAIFPRILFASEIRDHIPKEKISFKYIQKDSDNFLYLDFFRYHIDINKLSKKKLTHVMKTQGVIALLENSYNKYATSHKKIAQKYGWLISKLNEHDIQVRLTR